MFICSRLLLQANPRKRFAYGESVSPLRRRRRKNNSLCSSPTSSTCRRRPLLGSSRDSQAATMTMTVDDTFSLSKRRPPKHLTMIIKSWVCRSDMWLFQATCHPWLSIVWCWVCSPMAGVESHRLQRGTQLATNGSSAP